MSKNKIHNNAFSKTIILLLIVALMTESLSTVILAETEATEKGTFFDNPEINKLIDENHEKVEQNGYSELRIPRSLHHIEESVFTDNALEVGRKLIEAGYSAYVIGGCIRDFIMGTDSNDIDITTNATLEEQRELFGDALTTHESQGRVFGGVEFPDESVDLATFQNVPKEYKDIDYIPEFDPDKMTGDSVVHDSFQRDLALNAIYYDLSNGDLLDFHDGIYDIREGILDTMVDAETEIKTDPRVVERAIRFNARYGFNFSDDLDAAIREYGNECLQKISPSDSFINISKMMCAGYALDAYHLLEEYGLLESLYPSLKEAMQHEDYRTYIESAISYMDQQVNSSEEDASWELTLLAFIQPEIMHRAKQSTMAEAINEVLDEQAEVFEFDRRREDIYKTSLLMMQMLKKSSRFSADSIQKSPYFSDALTLLNMMALVEEPAREQAEFWNEYAEEEVESELENAA